MNVSNFKLDILLSPKSYPIWPVLLTSKKIETGHVSFPVFILKRIFGVENILVESGQLRRIRKSECCLHELSEYLRSIRNAPSVSA